MTKSELDALRNRVPWWILVIGLVPWVLITVKDFEQAKFRIGVLIPFAAIIVAFFYVGTGFRNSVWKREMDAHVGKQIRESLLQLIPADLNVTENEKNALAEKEVYRKLTGVFWEAVDSNDVLKSHKEHFYANGIKYSTSIDVYILGLAFSLLYGISSLLLENLALNFVSFGCVLIALCSRLFVTTSRRKRHLELSAEQLDLLRREQGAFVQRRFREIVLSWRERANPA